MKRTRKRIAGLLVLGIALFPTRAISESLQEHECGGVWIQRASCAITLTTPGWHWEIIHGAWAADPSQNDAGTIKMDNTATLVLRNADTGVVVHQSASGGVHSLPEADQWLFGGGGRQEEDSIPAGRYECVIEGHTAGQYSCTIWAP